MRGQLTEFEYLTFLVLLCSFLLYREGYTDSDCISSWSSVLSSLIIIIINNNNNKTMRAGKKNKYFSSRIMPGHSQLGDFQS